jgi:hypothetical protein
MSIYDIVTPILFEISADSVAQRMRSVCLKILHAPLDHAQRRHEAHLESLETEHAEVEAGLMKLMSTLQPACWIEAGISAAIWKRLNDLNAIETERQECERQLTIVNNSVTAHSLDGVLHAVKVSFTSVAEQCVEASSRGSQSAVKEAA